MPTLILFRHAKSSWDHPELEDFDRPLAARGRKAAPLMGAYIARERLVPDLVLCSAARRARETLDLAAPEWRPLPRIDYSGELYMAAPATLMDTVRKVPVDVGRLMVVGHNPGLEEFALGLTGAGDTRARSAMAAKFPTAAVAVIELDAADWSAIGNGKGRLASFTTPRQLGKR